MEGICAVVCLVAQSCPTLCDPTDHSLPGSSVPGDSPGKNTGVGGLSLLQAIFPTQELNRGLLHWRQIPTSWATREAHGGNMQNVKCTLDINKIMIQVYK